jgi:signal transduction histidine kinase/ActR/RegA family two-component response regulator
LGLGVQAFINRIDAERVAAEIFSGPRRQYHLMLMIAAAVTVAAGAALAAIWLGLALLVEETRRVLVTRNGPLSPSQSAAALTLDIVASASFATAPVIAWYARGELGAALAIGMLCMMLINTAINARRGRIDALLSCGPYVLTALVFALEGAAAGAPSVALAALGACAYVFFAVLNQTHRANHARMQDAEWVRQLNMSFGEANSAAWEIDFTRQRLIGAERLATVLGRNVSYSDVVENCCFAAPEDRALVTNVFSPAPGAIRRFALEHDVVHADGARVRVRHQGFVRTTPDGAPVRVTCVTRPGGAEQAGAQPQGETVALSAHALKAQAEVLKTLKNELSSGAETGAPAPLETPMSLMNALHALVSRMETIEIGVDDLARARHEAESANLAKSQFLANMSHELRTPLNAIIGYAEMLQEDAEDSGDSAAVQDLNRILTAAKHLLSLINEILDLSKIEAGRMDVAAAPFDPLETLDELIETVRPIAEQNGNTIQLAGALPEGMANTDAMKLRQCVLNLLSNASKFTKNGTIEVLYDRRAHNGVAQIFITVRDTGIGMKPEHLARLFQPFVQADPSITQQYGGTGLGLTITRRLAQLLGGDVSVESVHGQGSAFTIHVPTDFADASAALGAAAEIDAVQGAEGAPLVIVIEDEPDARELAARALTRAGFAVQGVGGGEAGLTLARQKKPALVLLDIFLPDRSGWRVLQSLKHDPKTQDIPVVVLSVNEDRAHALSLGAAEHIVKPADRDMLAATVMRFARLPAMPAAAPAASSEKKQAG